MPRTPLAVASSCAAVLLMLLGALPVRAADLSEASQECLECHEHMASGLAASWHQSAHSRMSPAEALKKEGLALKVSSKSIPEEKLNHAVGCAECHTLNPDKHKDTFEHNGYNVHVVVTPEDCATCHAEEADQFKQNIMSHARGNLLNNDLFRDMVKNINGVQSIEPAPETSNVTVAAPDDATNALSCLYCHGTQIEVTGTATRDSEFGDVEVPVLSGWPNNGVGRVNPDGSLGSCAACHTRHQFSIATARNPATCSECHIGPDVPAYKVYSASKHGNLYAAHGKEWNWEEVPWRAGKDFTAPTCAACHISLVVDGEGGVVAQRTHRINDRLPWRILGLVYAHPHPVSPDTSIIRNAAGLPLPTDFTGEPAAKFLIDQAEMDKRRETLQGVCLSCHSTSWVEGHWARFENAIKTTNATTLAATKLMTQAWEKGYASGWNQSAGIFDEAVERKWAEQWLFFENTTRLSAAIAGGGDYGSFANGRWQASRNVLELQEWLKQKDATDK